MTGKQTAREATEASYAAIQYWRGCGFDALTSTDAGIRCVLRLLRAVAPSKRKAWVSDAGMPMSEEWDEALAFDPDSDLPIPLYSREFVRGLCPMHRLYVMTWEALIEWHAGLRLQREKSIAAPLPESDRKDALRALSCIGPDGDPWAIPHSEALDPTAVDAYMALTRRSGRSLSGLVRVVAEEKRIYLDYRKALDALVCANMESAKNAARRMFPGLNEDWRRQLESVAYEATMLAAERVDYNMGANFKTYSEYWIRGECRSALFQELNWAGMTGREADDALKVYGIQCRLVANDPDNAGLDEVAKAADMEVGYVASLMDAMTAPLSLDTPIGGDGESSVCLLDSLESDSHVDDALVRVEAIEAVRAGVRGLPDTEREVLSLLYGLDGTPPLSALEVAKRTGLTRYFVQKAEESAMNLLTPGDADLVVADDFAAEAA